MTSNERNKLISEVDKEVMMITEQNKEEKVIIDPMAVRNQG